MRVTNRTKLVGATLIGLLCWTLYFLWPVYGFLSHQKGWAHAPWGWLTFPSSAPQQQKVSQPDFTYVGKQALSALAKHRLNINAPAITAAVAIDGRQVWAGAVGWADIEKELPATVDTQFRIGSTSKALNATALARLMQADLIDLDQPLKTLFKSPTNPQWKNITPRHLASHSAGLPHYKETKDIEGLMHFMRLQTHYDDVEQATKLFDQTPLLFPPGEKFSYSSLGTVLLSNLMQKASGMKYQKWVKQQVLDPLKMHVTLGEKASPTLATPYWRDKTKKSTKLRVWRKVDLSHRLAGGGFISTSSDLIKLGLGYFNPEFLDNEIVNQIWQPQTLNNGLVNPQKYAIGWRQGNIKLGKTKSKTFHHGGVSRGGQSWLIVIPDYKMAIAVNANINTKEFWDFASVYRELAQLFYNTVH
ncbi:serine hydrolase domain-containing protein [Paraglaciecola sp.]|uniref:serine hydrolase domain-containing protein n=1 Tax=Paraglaciecola sp. TaxID=1920173 RepID=UPI003EFB398A